MQSSRAKECVQAAGCFTDKIVGRINSDVHIELGKNYDLLEPMKRLQRRHRPGVVFTTDGDSS